MTFKVTRECAGLYTVGAPGADILDTVEVVHFTRYSDGVDYDYWIAKAQWSHYLHTDPCTTKREAVTYALEMLAERKVRA